MYKKSNVEKHSKGVAEGRKPGHSKRTYLLCQPRHSPHHPFWTSNCRKQGGAGGAPYSKGRSKGRVRAVAVAPAAALGNLTEEASKWLRGLGEEQLAREQGE